MIKKFLTSSACLFLLSALLCAQEYVSATVPEVQYTDSVKQRKPIDVRDVYLGISTGIDYVGLLGITAEFNIWKNLAIAGGLGIGGWGYKTMADVRFYKRFPASIYYVAGINRSTGIPEITLELETTSGDMDDITMELEPVINIDLGVGYAWRLGRRARFGLELGYAVDASSGDGYLIAEQQPELSDTSKKVMTMMKPGGLRFGLGFSFGL